MTVNAIQAIKPGAGRSRISGLVLLATGLAIFLLFGMNLEPGLQAKFGLNPGYVSQAVRIPDLILPVQNSLYALILITLFVGGWQLERGFRSTGAVVGIVAFCFVTAFLIWAARGKSFNLVGMLGKIGRASCRERV